MRYKLIKFNLVKVIAFSVLLFASQFAVSEDEMDYMLSETSPPDGVVFEILTREESTWIDVLSYINKSVERLHSKFPNVPIAIVSHGQEQFALLKKNTSANAAAHSEVQSLLKNNIKVEVCGTYAEWKGHETKDFPDYVTVVDHAPESIESYEEADYVLIVIDKEYLKELNK